MHDGLNEMQVTYLLTVKLTSDIPHMFRRIDVGGTFVQAFHEEERVEKVERAVSRPRVEPAV